MTPERLGDFGEAIWQNVLDASGWHYVSLAKICEGGAPMARKRGDCLILPDFDAFQGGRSIFVEAKAKSQSIYYRRIGKERHGINQNNYRHYRRIAAENGKRMALAIVELQGEREPHQLSWSGSLLIQTFNELPEPSPSDYPESPVKVYWNRKEFREIDGGLTAQELVDLANHKTRRCYRLELDSVFFPQKQTELF